MEQHDNQNDLQKQLVDYDNLELDESAQGLLATSVLSAPPANSMGKLGGAGHYTYDHLNSGSSTA
jgi:hypothetical protein